MAAVLWSRWVSPEQSKVPEPEAGRKARAEGMPKAKQGSTVSTLPTTLEPTESVSIHNWINEVKDFRTEYSLINTDE